MCFTLLLILGHPIQHLIVIVTLAVAEGSGVAKAFLGETPRGAKSLFFIEILPSSAGYKVQFASLRLEGALGPDGLTGAA